VDGARRKAIGHQAIHQAPHVAVLEPGQADAADGRVDVEPDVALVARPGGGADAAAVGGDPLVEVPAASAGTSGGPM
jgi:hypothetical protein